MIGEILNNDTVSNNRKVPCNY